MICPRCGTKYRTAQLATHYLPRAMLPQDYADKRIGDFDWNVYPGIDVTEKRRMVNDFIENFSSWDDWGQGLYIQSSTSGTGKTLLASCIVGELIARRGLNARFINISDLLNAAVNSQNGARNVIGELRSCSLLVIDDIGAKKKGAEFLDDVLYQIIDDRTNRKLPTIYTSNQSHESLGIDERIIRRIKSKTLVLALPEIPVAMQKANAEQKKFARSRGFIK